MKEVFLRIIESQMSQTTVFGIVIASMLIFFLFLLVSAQRKKKINWIDLVSRDGKTLSASKILQLVGGVIASWVVVKLTLQEALSWDLFVVYLTYVASVDGFAKWVNARYTGGSSTPVVANTADETKE